MMNKRILKYLKRTFAIALVVLLNVNTYAAIGGNDGSAFVTKAEFDAMVNTFNEQMDNYESSLVSKIDGAIANYLSSLSSVMTITLDDLSSRIRTAGIEYITFYNYPSQGFDDSNDGNNGKAGSYYLYASRNNAQGVYMRVSSLYATVAGALPSCKEFGSKNCFYMLDDTDLTDTGSGYEDKAIFLKSKKSFSNYITILNSGIWSSISDWTGSTNVNDLWNNSTKNHTVTISNQNSFSGNYTDTENNTKLGNAGLSCDADISSAWTEASDTKFAGTGYSSCGVIQSATLKGIKYSDRGLFNGTQQTINGCYGSTAGGRIYSYQNGTTTYGTYSPEGGQTWIYKYYWHKVYNTDVTKICNYGASSILNLPVYLYCGIPLTKVSTTGKVRFSCTLINSKGNDTYLTISDEPFDNANRYNTKPYTVGTKTYDHILYNEKIATGKSNDIEFDVKYIANPSNPTVLYYRLSQETFADSTVSMYINMDTGISMVTGDE